VASLQKTICKIRHVMGLLKPVVESLCYHLYPCCLTRRFLWHSERFRIVFIHTHIHTHTYDLLRVINVTCRHVHTNICLTRWFLRPERSGRFMPDFLISRNFRFCRQIYPAYQRLRPKWSSPPNPLSPANREKGVALHLSGSLCTHNASIYTDTSIYALAKHIRTSVLLWHE